jgi:hypothetical protein
MNISVKTVIMRLLSSYLLKNLKLNQKSNALIVKVIMCRKKSPHLLQKQVKNHNVKVRRRCGYMEELTKAQIAIVKEIEKLIVELRGGTEDQIWKRTFENILNLVDEFELRKHKETIESIYDKFMKEGLYEYAGRFAEKCNL